MAISDPTGQHEKEKEVVHQFNYVKPKSLAEAQSLVKANEEAKIMSGGMTLIPTLKARLADPTHLVDVSQLPELRGIEATAQEVTIGAATRHFDVATSATVRKAIPALAYLAGLIGDPQVRNLGTIGGSLANNDPAADYPAAALSLGATIVTDRREIPADEYFQGLFTTSLEPGELVMRIRFPVPKDAAYEKFPHPASGYAMCGAFVSVFGSGVRVAITGAGGGVFRWAEAEKALTAKRDVEPLATLPLADDDFSTDIHATRDYRANLVRVMTKRAVLKLK